MLSTQCFAFDVVINSIFFAGYIQPHNQLNSEKWLAVGYKLHDHQHAESIFSDVGDVELEITWT